MTGMQHLMMKIYNNDEAIGVVEPLMTAFLESDATAAGKHYVCRELGIMGTSGAVPVLTRLLHQPGMSSTALLALERIPGNEADQALLKSLEEADETEQISIINALAIRQVHAAVPALANDLYSTDEQLARAALSALGSIGGRQAVKELQTFFKAVPETLKRDVQDALMRCAADFIREGNPKDAAPIFDQVYEAALPYPLKYNALEGKFRTSAEAPYSFLLHHLRQTDPGFHPYIVQLVYKLDGSHVLGRLFDDLPGMPDKTRAHLYSALAVIGDASVRTELIRSLRNAEEAPDVRKSALQALACIGEPADAIFLAELAAAGRGKEKEQARQSLDMLPGTGTNEVIRSGIAEESGEVRAELIRSTGERNMADAVGILFDYTQDPERNVRLATIRALGRLASPEYLPDLITVMLGTGNRRERQEAERAVFAVTQKIPENKDPSASLEVALADAPNPAAAASLITVIGMIGDAGDLPLLREYLQSSEEEIQLAVIRSMSGWPDAGPMEDLKGLASSTTDPRKHTLSLRGYVEVVLADDNMSSDDKFLEIRRAYEMATNTAESRMVISGLSRIGNPEALEMAIGLLDDPDLKNEAEAAVARIAEQTGWGYPEETTRQLKAVLEKIDNQEVVQSIHRILERIN
jgi:HEAT repeat protein